MIGDVSDTCRAVDFPKQEALGFLSTNKLCMKLNEGI
jgi:hypothetical protein